MRYVYVIRNLINEKVYIGQTKNFDGRKADHLYAARKGNNRPLYASIRKYGVENFSFEIIETCEDNRIDEREIHWISYYDSMNSDRGYNLTPGGDGWSINHNEPLRKEKNKRTARAMNRVTWANPEFRNRKIDALVTQTKRLFVEGKLKAPNWTGRRHKEETKQKIGNSSSIHNLGKCGFTIRCFNDHNE